MNSIFERPGLNKIFLIYGNIDDMFITPDLQRKNFRPFLNSYLHSIGYECVVFYSGAKNTGKYVLDDKSALIAINVNKNKNSSSPSPSVKPKRRIAAPNIKANENQNQNVSQDSTPAQNPEKRELIYKQPKITPAEFLDEAKKLMSDSSVKTAIIFTFFQDFVSDNSAPVQQYSELL